MSVIYTPKFRVSFNDMFQATQINGEGKAKYRLTMIFNLAEIAKDPEEQKKWDNLLAGIDEALKKKFSSIPAEYRKPFIDGDTCTNKETSAIYEGYEGMVIVRTATDMQPGLVNEAREPIISESDFPSGCYAHATVSPFAWSHKMTGKGVSIGLNNVQKLAEGEPIGGRTRAEDDFKPIETAVKETSNAGLFD